MTPHDPDLDRLSPAQRAALHHVHAAVHRAEVAARACVINLLRRAGCATGTYAGAMERLRLHARVVVHFHPDRLGPKSTTVAEALLDEGVYRSQFETGLSSGGLSAFRGGARDSWENALFGGAYHTDGVAASERPKYGALELVRHPDGPLPRFGSCYVVLRRDVSIRTSFTFMGSEDPRATERLGTIGRMDAVMAALFSEIEAGGMASPPCRLFMRLLSGFRISPSLDCSTSSRISSSLGGNQPTWRRGGCSTPGSKRRCMALST